MSSDTATDSDAQPTDTPDVHEEVEHTKTGVELTLESKRGTGTRDQDSVKMKVRGKTMAEVESQRADAREMVITEITALRANQPDEEDD